MGQEITDQGEDRLSNTESLMLPSGAGVDCHWSAQVLPAVLCGEVEDSL